MSSGSFLPPGPGSGGPRRSMGSIYDNPILRRRSPSPPRRISSTYDGYAPNQPAPPYRADFQFANNYRSESDAWRAPPVRSASAYYGRGHSPDRYERPELPPINVYNRPVSSNSWQPPPSPVRSPIDPPPSASRDRSQRDMMAQSMSQPLFEPSATWKKSHDDKAIRPESSTTSPVAHAYSNRRPISPRSERLPPPYYANENAYRPPPPMLSNYREPISARGPVYRSQYDENGSWRRGATQPTSAGYTRRNSMPDPARIGYGNSPLIGPGAHTRSASYNRARAPSNPNYNGYPRSRSASRSRSPPKISTGLPNSTIHLSRRRRTPSISRSHSRSRSDSTSDVASTRASERSPRESPTATILESVRHVLPPKPQQAVASESSEVEPALASPPSLAPKSSLVERQPELNRNTLQRPIVTLINTSNSGDSYNGPSKSNTPCNQTPANQTPNYNQPTNILQAQNTNQIRISDSLQPPAKHSGTPQAQIDSIVASAIPTDQDAQSKAVQLSLNLSSPPSPPERLPNKANAIVRKMLINETAEKVVQNDFWTSSEEEEKLPDLSDAMSIADALRIVVMTRLRCDRQTREERVNPVLMANHSIAEVRDSKPLKYTEDFVREVIDGKRLQTAFASNEDFLAIHFSQHRESVISKADHLREEYLALHEKWQAHCAKLDNKSSKKAARDFPAPSEETVQALPASSGRSTRRTAAMLGDAVRSDLEMEQIIASLGVEELTDPNHLALRNLAKIPDMVSVTKGCVEYVFDDTNNLVDNPIEFYDSSKDAHSWTEEEQEIYLEQFAANPKQFGIIASFLPSKTAAQCVTYYYLHKKKYVDFRKVISLYAPGKRRRGGRRTDKQKGNALMADIRQHDDEVSISQSGPTTRRKRAIIPSAFRLGPSRLEAARLEFTPTTATPTPDPEPEAKKRGRRPNIIARAANGPAEEAEEDNAAKPAKKGRKPGRKPKTPAVVPDEADESNQGESAVKRKPSANTQWSDDDKNQFLKLLGQHGDDFKRIAASMPNKTSVQVQNFFKGNNAELGLATVAAQAPKRSPTPGTPAFITYAELQQVAFNNVPSAPTLGKVAKKEVSAKRTPIVAEPPLSNLSLSDINPEHPNNQGSFQVQNFQGSFMPQATFASSSSGDLSGTLNHPSGLTNTAQHLGNDAASMIHRFQILPFTRFVTVNPRKMSPTASSPPQAQYSNREARVASGHEPVIYRFHEDQTGLIPVQSGVIKDAAQSESCRDV